MPFVQLKRVISVTASHRRHFCSQISDRSHIFLIQLLSGSQWLFSITIKNQNKQAKAAQVQERPLCLSLSMKLHKQIPIKPVIDSARLLACSRGRKVKNMLWVFMFDNKVSELAWVTRRHMEISNWPLGECHNQPRLKMRGFIKLEAKLAMQPFDCYFSCSVTGTWKYWRWRCLLAFGGDRVHRQFKKTRQAQKNAYQKIIRRMSHESRLREENGSWLLGSWQITSEH